MNYVSESCLPHIYCVLQFLSMCSTTMAKSTLIAAYSTQMERNRVNIYKFVASHRHPILEALLGHLDNWFVTQLVATLYGNCASIHFRHRSVINSTNLTRLQCQREAAIVAMPLASAPFGTSLASACRLSELTVLTLSARTSASEYIFAYISARGKCNHWKSVVSQRGVCLLKRNPQFMQSTRVANWFTQDAYVAQN